MTATQEQTIWTGNPSHITGFGTYLLCGVLCFLVIPLFIILWKYLQIKNTVYEVTTQRIRISTGVLSKQTQELELYRVRDYQIRQSFWQRIFSVGDIELTTSDKVLPDVVLHSVPEHKALREKMRAAVEEVRERKGVRPLEV